MSIREFVMMDFKKESPMPHIPKFEVKTLLDEPSLAWEASKLFQELISGLEFKQVYTSDFQDVCPEPTRLKLMQGLTGLHVLVDAKKIKSRCMQLPPLPPKKTKNISFILEPTVVKATVEELQEMRAKKQQGQGAILRQSAMKKIGQVPEQQKAIAPKL
jgi:hypothetical protein